jgi:hypothetical protein
MDHESPQGVLLSLIGSVLIISYSEWQISCAVPHFWLQMRPNIEFNLWNTVPKGPVIIPEMGMQTEKKCAPVIVK